MLLFLRNRDRSQNMVFLCVFVALLIGHSAITEAAPASRPASRPAKLQTHYEKSRFLETVHPSKVMSFYRALARKSPWVRIEKIGVGDGGRPIHLVILSKKGGFASDQKSKKVVVMLNNGIHAGETCGIDASQMLTRDLLHQMRRSNRYDDLILLVIPVYNVGGHAKFSAFNRVNQVGPKQMGFRGNARNYDLNRDFMKADTANARTFYRAFQRWQPDVFIDNHTTDGADFRHVMTYMLTSTPATPPPLRRFLRKHFQPSFEQKMKKAGFPLIPYVVLKVRDQLQKGLIGFVSSPRYSLGYARLFNSIGILSEAHMLKTYKQRVQGTYQLDLKAIDTALANKQKLKQARQAADRHIQTAQNYTLRWKRTEKVHKIDFLGFRAEQRTSRVSGARYVFYDRSKPIDMKLPYYNDFLPKLSIKIPKAYIVPKAWKKVLARLRWQGVQMKQIDKTHQRTVERYLITNIKWRSRPYEGHLRPLELRVEKVRSQVTVHKGDFWISTKQKAVAYVIEALEPMAMDSFISWNFFDTVVQQKEYFDTYLFVHTAKKILEKDKKLRQIFERRLRTEPDFAKSPRKRLQFIYQSSRYYEGVHNVYPILRVPF